MCRVKIRVKAQILPDLRALLTSRWHCSIETSSTSVLHTVADDAKEVGVEKNGEQEVEVSAVTAPPPKVKAPAVGAGLAAASPPKAPPKPPKAVAPVQSNYKG